MQGSITWLLVVAVITTEAVLQFLKIFFKKNLELKENKKNLKKKKKNNNNNNNKIYYLKGNDDSPETKFKQKQNLLPFLIFLKH